MNDDNLSDESIYAIYQFLQTLSYEFEATNLVRLRRYTALKNNSSAQQQPSIDDDDPPF